MLMGQACVCVCTCVCARDAHVVCACVFVCAHMCVVGTPTQTHTLREAKGRFLKGKPEGSCGGRGMGVGQAAPPSLPHPPLCDSFILSGPCPSANSGFMSPRPRLLLSYCSVLLGVSHDYQSSELSPYHPDHQRWAEGPRPSAPASFCGRRNGPLSSHWPGLGHMATPPSSSVPAELEL